MLDAQARFHRSSLRTGGCFAHVRVVSTCIDASMVWCLCEHSPEIRCRFAMAPRGSDVLWPAILTCVPWVVRNRSVLECLCCVHCCVHCSYIIHESAVWSKIHRRWYFLPRRSSNERYELPIRKTLQIISPSDQSCLVLSYHLLTYCVHC